MLGPTVSWRRIVIEICHVTEAIVVVKRLQEASFLAVTFLIGLVCVQLFLGYVG